MGVYRRACDPQREVMTGYGNNGRNLCSSSLSQARRETEVLVLIKPKVYIK
ncbi:hypothetical protein P4O66_009805, partial [Electrophorus voltai]